jgi:isoquinoline 1-oxidoreductase
MSNERDTFDDLPFEPERYELYRGPAYRFDMNRRDFIKLLGGGLVVVITFRAATAAAQGPAGGGLPAGEPPPADLAAWLQVAEDGTIHVYSGKTEVGQNVRTMLTQVVAEELRVPPAQVRMVLADTDLTPFDLGTFGSRSAPLMVPQIRKVSVAARELLMDMAAAQWRAADRNDIVIESGRLTNRRTNQSASFGEITKGQELVKVIEDDPKITPASEWKVTGTSLRKVNGRDIVTGRHQFPIDIRRPGMVFGKVVRAPAYNSELESVNSAAAQALPGVTFVRDGELDTRRVGAGEVIDINPTVMFVRDGGFVGVTGPTDQLAARAASALTANWKTGENVAEAALFDHLRKPPRGGAPVRPQDRGSMESGMAAADFKTEETYTAAYIAHTPLEPRAAVAEWTNGKLTVWTGTQRPWGVRAELAEAFRMPEEQVRVIVPDTGSGYGGKHTGEAAIEAARLAKAAGKPVKVVWSREEEFMWGYFRPAGVIDVSSGVTKEGLITAWEFHNYNSGSTSIRPVYDIPNQRIVFHPSDSPMRQGSYRGLAAAAKHFARESHMDVLAAKVGLDPLEFRYRNLKDPRLRAVFDAGAERFVWGRDKSGPERGYGFGGGLDKGGYISTFAEVSIDRNGGVRVERVVAAFEVGAILNPDQVRNQVEGSIVQGIGGALFEAVHFDAGKVVNGRLSQYRVPRFSDTPSIDVVLIDRKDLPSSGAGESPIVGIAPAIGNAIAAATGIRLRSLPMAPAGLTP